MLNYYWNLLHVWSLGEARVKQIKTLVLDLERYDIGTFKYLEVQDRNIFRYEKQIEDYKKYIENLEIEIDKIKRSTSHMKETIKTGNGIDKDYCKWLLDNQ